jgi:WD40 repeat protein/serine/threonine protein kinase
LHDTFSPISPGTRADAYRIVRLIARGGMGEVYLARDLRLGRPAALKFLAGRLCADPALVRMFIAEARLTARVSHPNVVTVYGVGSLEGRPYVALEHVEGDTLQALLSAGPPSPEDAVATAAAIARAVSSAHEYDVLHRDLKPANVIMGRDGRVRVVDFGIAKVLGVDSHESGDATDWVESEGNEHGAIERTEKLDLGLETSPRGARRQHGAFGTPAYMAPERWAGIDSKAADIWALGVMLHELLVGEHPFAGLPDVVLMQRIACVEPVAVSNKLRDVPTELSQLVLHCLRKDPAERPAAREVSDVLAAFQARRSDQLDLESNPFPGLASFGEDDETCFFGRDDDVARVLEGLRSHVMVAVVGPSGVGKSSLVAAGLLPRLRRQGSWIVVRFRPGSRPIHALASRLTLVESRSTTGKSASDKADPTTRVWRDSSPPPRSTTQDSEEARGPDIDVLAQSLVREPERLASMLYELAVRQGSRVLVYVDQLEELVTQGENAEERRAFVRSLATAAMDPEEPVRVLFTVRDDFLGRIDWGDAAAVALGHVTFVRVPERDVLRRTVTDPLRQRGYAFDDPTVVEDLLDGARGQHALPLLQFVLHRLWELRDVPSRRLLRAAYEQVGGLAGALADHADRTLAPLTDDEVRAARGLLLRLVTPERTRRTIGVQRALDGLGPCAAGVLETLVRSRLLVTRPSRDAAGGVWVELVHESLPAMWLRYARWIEETREELIALRELSLAAELWARRGKRAEELWAGSALQEALDVLEHGNTAVSDDVREFVRLALDRDQARQRRSRRVRVLAIGGLVALATLSSLAAWGFRRNAMEANAARRASELARVTVLRETAAVALANGDVFQARARLRSALELGDSSALRTLWRQLRADPRLWRADLDGVNYEVALSPDQRWIAAAGQSGLVLLVDTTSFQSTLLRGHHDQVISVSFSPTANLLASGGWNGELLLWNLSTGTARVLQDRGDMIMSVRFAPDGRALAVAMRSGHVLWFDVEGSLPPKVIVDDDGGTRQMQFAPDGTLWLGGFDGTLRVLDPLAGKGRTLASREDSIYSLAVRPDGGQVAVGGDDGAVQLYEPSGAGPIASLRGHEGRVRGLAYLGDGAQLLSCGSDSTLRVWDTSTARQLTRMRSDQGMLTRVTSAADARTIATSSSTGIELWRLSSPVASPTPPRPPDASVLVSVATSPDGKLIVTGGSGCLDVWDATTFQRLLRVPEHESGEVRGVQVLDNRRVLSAIGRSPIKIRDLVSGETLKEIESPRTTLGDLAADVNRDWIAAGGTDGVLRFWTLSQGVPLSAQPRLLGIFFDLAKSPDGSLVATAGSDGTVMLSSPRGSKSRAFSVSGRAVQSVAFDPGGEFLMAASEDGALHRIDLSSGAVERLGQYTERFIDIAFHPTRPLLAAASTKGDVVLMDPNGGSLRRLRGHRREVNAVTFTPQGDYIVSVSDDKTVRRWNVETGKPSWFAVGLVGSPSASYTHAGWVGPGATEWASSHPWRTIVEGSRLSTDEGPSLCTSDFEHRVRYYVRGNATPVAQDQGAPVDRLLACPTGCLVRRGGRADFLSAGGLRTLGDRVSAWACGEQSFVLVTDDRLLELDVDGKVLRSEPRAGVRAALVEEAGTALGFDDGSIEVCAPGTTGPGVRLLRTPSSPVEVLRAGPRGTVAAGFEDGNVGVWEVDSGELLAQTLLVGPVLDLRYEAPSLFAVTELGDHGLIDLGVLALPRCDVLREVWADVHFVWKEGRAVAAPLPLDHPCATP